MCPNLLPKYSKHLQSDSVFNTKFPCWSLSITAQHVWNRKREFCTTLTLENTHLQYMANLVCGILIFLCCRLTRAFKRLEKTSRKKTNLLVWHTHASMELYGTLSLRRSDWCKMSKWKPNKTMKKHLLFGPLGSVKDWSELRHGHWSGSNKHQPWKPSEPEAPDRVGDELCSWQVQTLWTWPCQSSGVQPVASLPPWRRPAAYERRPGLLAQQPHWWDIFLLILRPNSC